MTKPEARGSGRPEPEGEHVRTCILRCLACGARVRADVAMRPGVVDVTIAHEDDCPYYLAIEQGPDAVIEWVEQHGHPIRYEVPS
jgi:hypothetical protein